ncbi:MAG TPA: hypothetical protein VF519_15035 [Mycobacteriales bacterium]|jgi:hypothetical protein
MRRALAVAALAALPLSVAAPGPASAGCVRDFTALTVQPTPDDDPIVRVNPDGSITVDPAPAEAAAFRAVGLGYHLYERTFALVRCTY